ncbi:MAG: RidA family protein [Granulosicoccaceae bacterium]
MSRKLISSGSEFESSIAYSRAVVDGNWVMVSGTTGYDYSNMTVSEDVLEQTEQCFKNIETALHQAGATLADVVRVTYIYPDAQDFPKCWPVLKRYLGEVKPAATMFSAGLANPAMKVEIQVTALMHSS